MIKTISGVVWVGVVVVVRDMVGGVVVTTGGAKGELLVGQTSCNDWEVPVSSRAGKLWM